MVRLGIDRIGENLPAFSGRRIGLITNYSGVSSDLTDNLTVFARWGCSVTRLFTPEHGLYGAMDGAAVESGVHPGDGIPIVSLYGDKQMPDPADLEGLDLLVYDIQDVGLRYYTFIYTLANCMQAAAKAGLPLVVLDRPNPLGSRVLGNRMDPRYDSFVGAHGLATRYGLTPGELGNYFWDFLKLDLDYTVLPMEGYRPEMTWPETGQLWNTPSPALGTFASTLCYAGGCFLEATNCSEGRGTAAPFRIYGAPFVDMDRLVRRLRERIHEPKLALRTRAFTPFYAKYSGQTCFGVELIPLEADLDFMSTSLVLMKTLGELYPEEFTVDYSRMAALSGDRGAQDYLEDRLSLEELLERWQIQSEEFAAQAMKYRIYE